jgi:hypothetical protein
MDMPVIQDITEVLAPVPAPPIVPGWVFIGYSDAKTELVARYDYERYFDEGTVCKAVPFVFNRVQFAVYKKGARQ